VAPHALTIALLKQGRPIVFEGAPGVGKTSLVMGMGAALRQLVDRSDGVVCHYEDRNDALLRHFDSDPQRYAGWLQVFKLAQRQLVLAKIDLALRKEPSTIHLVDRSLPGDYSFFLYHERKGNITPEMAAAYYHQLKQCRSTPPLLVFYMTAPAPTTIKRIEERGVAWEKKAYDTDFYSAMDAAHREAFNVMGVPHATIDWSEEHHDGVVPPERCLEILEQGLRAAYGTNWDKLVV
jgi:deoxyadenosine/deoxycytidine kinase